jgi:hypothetical protein
MGRNPKPGITAEAIEMLAAAGLNVTQVAYALSISRTQLYERFPDGKLDLIMSKGYERGNLTLLNKGFTLAANGNTHMLRFLLERRIPELRRQIVHSGSIHHDHDHVHKLSEQETLRRIAELESSVKLALKEGVPDVVTIDGGTGTAGEREVHARRETRRRARKDRKRVKQGR